jgi:hypothetical protein
MCLPILFEEKRMYSDPRFVLGIGSMAFLVLFGLFSLVHARLRARKIRMLEQRGRATAASVTSIHFKALNRRGDTYGLVSFTYEYEGKMYVCKQAITEHCAQDFLRGSTSAYALVLPEDPGCARLASSPTRMCYDPTIDTETTSGIIAMLFPLILVVLIIVVAGIGLLIARQMW